MKKVLFLTNHRPDRSPGQRFRFEQYLEHLSQNGFECEISPLLNQQDDRIFYSQGNWIKKFFILLKCFWRRLGDIKKARDFDVVFVFREAFFTGTIYFEKKLAQLPTKVIFDFDDSIWIPNVSAGNKRLEWLKNYDKTSELIKLADLVFAGNLYLANFASKNNKNVVIVPTTIDTDEYQKIPHLNNKICIGWSGSITTIQHFEHAIPFLTELKKNFGSKIEIKVIGDGNYVNHELNIKGIKWSKADEIKELSTFDIGIMPLPNDQWSNGKCGLKGLQYMALEIPTIMSPVGVNTEIIKDGVNGFLANDKAEWIEKISLLIKSKELRDKMGQAGRKTILKEYSVHAIRSIYLTSFNKLTK